jgi:hypothetical protein
VAAPLLISITLTTLGLLVLFPHIGQTELLEIFSPGCFMLKMFLIFMVSSIEFVPSMMQIRKNEKLNSNNKPKKELHNKAFKRMRKSSAPLNFSIGLTSHEYNKVCE